MKNDAIVFPARRIEDALERAVRDALGNKDGAITQAQFDSLTELHLGGNQLTSVDGLVLPAGLTTLYLGGNQIASVDGLVLPAGLTALPSPNCESSGQRKV